MNHPRKMEEQLRAFRSLPCDQGCQNSLSTSDRPRNLRDTRVHRQRTLWVGVWPWIMERALKPEVTSFTSLRSRRSLHLGFLFCLKEMLLCYGPCPGADVGCQHLRSGPSTWPAGGKSVVGLLFFSSSRTPRHTHETLSLIEALAAKTNMHVFRP